MMLDLRCALALHARFDPDREEIEIKCRDCSRKFGRPTHHRWALPDLIAAYRRGEMVGICEPSDPRFVHWRIMGG